MKSENPKSDWQISENAKKCATRHPMIVEKQITARWNRLVMTVRMVVFSRRLGR